MRRVVFSIMIIMTTGLLIYNAKNVYGSDEAFKEIPLKDTTPEVGFRYFSGNTEWVHNHPAMYAFVSDDETKIAVVGEKVYKEYPIEKLDKAFAAYTDLLIASGYWQ